MGSLPRGEPLATLLLATENNETVDPVALRDECARAMASAVDKQIACGIDIIGDGEIPRISFSTYVAQRMAGFGGQSNRPLPLDAKLFPEWLAQIRGSGVRRARVYDAPAAIAPVQYHDLGPARDECAMFRDCLQARGRTVTDAFVTAASPGIVTTTLMNQYYDSHEAYLFAVADEIAKEYRLVVEAGFTLQVDAPDIAMERAGFFQDKSHTEFLSCVEMHIAAINRALGEIPPDRVRLHACWGNRDSPHVHDVPSPDILPLIYEAHVGAICLPYANPRHQHEIDAFRTATLPNDVTLVPGVIETTNNYVEHPRVVAERIGRAVAAVGDRTRIIVGTDCGFGTLAGDSFVAPDVVWAKLRTLREGADIAAAEL